MGIIREHPRQFARFAQLFELSVSLCSAVAKILRIESLALFVSWAFGLFVF
jgi:hypothetical protein